MKRLARISTFVLMLFLGGPGFDWAQAQETDCEATLTAYQALKNGITYESAARIIGCKGSELSSTEMAGFKTVMYAWSGSGGWGANMNAMFQNNKIDIEGTIRIEMTSIV